ncbi:MAG TPA: hypothetical protein DCE62_01855 [Glaciecola sp.]|nr:hypothetical protein [Glaciecola sp.]
MDRSNQVQTGRYGSASEVVRTALTRSYYKRLFKIPAW